MPITMIFLPGRIPPRMRPLKGTVCKTQSHIVRKGGGTQGETNKKGEKKKPSLALRTSRRDRSSLSGEMRPGFPNESFGFSSSTFFNTCGVKGHRMQSANQLTGEDVAAAAATLDVI